MIRFSSEAASELEDAIDWYLIDQSTGEIVPVDSSLANRY